MPAIDDDDRPKKKVTHELGQDLTLLSVAELTERIALLRGEIARLESIPEATIRSRIKAGLQRLSLSLDDLLPEHPGEKLPLEPDTKGCRA